MSHCPAPTTYRQFAAPRENRAVLVDPPLAEAGRLLDDNRRLRRQLDPYDASGRSLAELSDEARDDLLDQARQWTAAYRQPDVPSVDPRGPILLAGHQPEVFHPGVWLKNFALGHLAEVHQAAAVNLLVDSDTIKNTSLRTPGGTPDAVEVQAIAMDRPEPRVAYEERCVVAPGLWADFGLRVRRQIASLVSRPLIDEYWPMVCERARHTSRLGHCLAQARHQLEGRWGLRTLEVPQSRVCHSRAFLWFVAHLLAELPRFRAIHNEAVQEYRRVHRIRSAAHPVPDLAAEGDWLEAPLWTWTEEDPRRRRLFARCEGKQIVLSDRHGLRVALPLAPGGNAAGAVEVLSRLDRQGVRIRSRALITTLWARLALGDLFLHGIGGAKYDQVTDRIIERFFGFQPPGFLVISGTLLLPVASSQGALDQDRTIRRLLREAAFHPERLLVQGDWANLSDNIVAGLRSRMPRVLPDEARDLIAAKQRLITESYGSDSDPLPWQGYQRWKAFRQVNESLQPWLDEARAWLQQIETQTARNLRAEQLLHWREFGFCLYPENELREFFSALLPKNV